MLNGLPRKNPHLLHKSTIKYQQTLELDLSLHSPPVLCALFSSRASSLVLCLIRMLLIFTQTYLRDGLLNLGNSLIAWHRCRIPFATLTSFYDCAKFYVTTLHAHDSVLVSISVASFHHNAGFLRS